MTSYLHVRLEPPSGVCPVTGALALLAAVLAVPPAARADLLFHEPFNTNTPDTATTISTYPALRFSHSDLGLVVVDGILHTPLRPFPLGTSFTLPDSFFGGIEFSFDIGASAGEAGFPVGARLMGSPLILFHPGLLGGAFRVDGIIPNTDMGFTPAVGTLHHMTIRSDGSGNFDVTVIDGENTANVFSTAFFSPAATSGLGALFVGNRAGLIDNIQVTAVSEPSALLLLAVGCGVFVLARVRGVPIRPAWSRAVSSCS